MPAHPVSKRACLLPSSQTPSRPGSLLVLPAGLYKPSAEGKELNTAYVYARGKWAAPIMHLPGHPKVRAVVPQGVVATSCRAGR